MTTRSYLPELQLENGYWRGQFPAMACNNEVLLEISTEKDAVQLFKIAFNEAKRIEQKYSRYRDDNIIHEINHAQGRTIFVDDETADLIDYAQLCYEMSEGLFDITSGILRRAWVFDGQHQLPSPKTIRALLRRIGWHKVHWQRPALTMPVDMEIDLGGIGKEYAVDRCVTLMKSYCNISMVVNFGGDLAVTASRHDGTPWTIGIDDPANTGVGSTGQIRLNHGALATSGDARRFIMKNGVRYGHILNPKTGWPIRRAPHSVTVVANSCLEAGTLSIFALLHGEHAEDFLKSQQVPYWLN